VAAPGAVCRAEHHSRRGISRTFAQKGDQAVRSDIVPGGVFPDYALPDHTGTVRTLSELQGRDPLILTLARGHYCPKEHQQHLEMATLLQPKAAVAYTKIVTISTDDLHELQEFRAVGAYWKAWVGGDYSPFHGWDRRSSKAPAAP